MVFDPNNRDRYPFDKPRRLKHLALSQIFCQLLNTSYIFTYNSFLYCRCDKFQGCFSKPVNGMIADRNYCYVCQAKVTDDEEKIHKLKKIASVYNNFIELKQDIQLCIDFDPSCNNFWMYHYSRSCQTGMGNFKREYLTNWIHYYIHKICYRNQ